MHEGVLRGVYVHYVPTNSDWQKNTLLIFSDLSYKTRGKNVKEIYHFGSFLITLNKFSIFTRRIRKHAF